MTAGTGCYMPGPFLFINCNSNFIVVVFYIEFWVPVVMFNATVMVLLKMIFALGSLLLKINAVIIFCSTNYFYVATANLMTTTMHCTADHIYIDCPDFVLLLA